MRWAFVILLVLHGAIHLLGVGKAWGVGPTNALTQPITQMMGLVWLAAALLTLAAAASCVFAPNWFWLVGGVALLVSETAIFSAWTDAKYGTVANVILLLGVVYGFGSRGPLSLRAEYLSSFRATLGRPVTSAIVTEADLQALPTPVQRYLRVTGAVGKPRIRTFVATWTGRIRGGASEPWMPFRAEQLNAYGGDAARLFFMSATMKHLPVAVFHRFVGDAATFRVRLLSLIPVVDAKGPMMNRAETVTIFNDLCLLAPAALLDAAVVWEPVDDRGVRARYTRGNETISAELVFNAAGELIDFRSDDRLAASPDGKSFTRMRWTTPTSRYATFEGRRVLTRGAARWEAPAGAFVYLELDLLRIEYNLAPVTRSPLELE